MRWYVPCKLGEWYSETKFLGWVKGTKVYGYTGAELQLIEVNVGMKADWSCVPEQFRDYVSVGRLGETALENYSIDKWNFEKMTLDVPDLEFEERLIGRKKVRLIGLRYSESGLLGHYVTADRYEHLYEPIDIKVLYSETRNDRYIKFEFKEVMRMSKDMEHDNAIDTISVEVVPGVEVEIEDIDKAAAAASAEIQKAEIEAAPNYTDEETYIVDDISIQAKAKGKLANELEKAKDTDFAQPIIEYLIKRCEEDAGFSEDVCQKQKTWNKCETYVYNQAKKQANGASKCAVRNDVVFEWAEDYYRKDDKAESKVVEDETENDEAEVIEDKPKPKEKKTKAKKTEQRNESVDTPEVENIEEEAPKTADEKPKPKAKAAKGNKDLAGQVSLFDML